MDAFFTWLSSNQIAAYIFIGGFTVLLLLIVVAFVQGREISFWPPKLGPKPEKTKSEKTQQNNKDVIHVKKDKVEIYGRKFFQVDVPDDLLEELIRISISSLIRIKVNDKYLLVKSARRKDLFQPVGGCFKRYPSSLNELSKLQVQNDNLFPIDEDNKGDLRIRILGKNLAAFMEWFQAGQSRETSPWREFYEELVSPGFLSSTNFPYIKAEYIKTIISGINFSMDYNINEIKIAEIFSLVPNELQQEELHQLQMKPNDRYIWVAQEILQERKHNPSLRHSSDSPDLSHTSPWIL